MSANRKLVISFVSLCVCILVALIGAKTWNDSQDKKLILQFNKDRKALAQQVIELQSSASNKMVDDYSIWSDLYQFSKKQDVNWAKENLDNVLPSYGLTSLYVFGENNQLVHSAVVAGQELPVLKFLDQPGKFPKGATAKTFFEWHGNDLFEVRVSHFVEDSSHKPLPGYFAIAKKIDATFLETISKLTNGTANVTQRANNFEEKTSTKPVFEMETPLLDISGTPIAWLSVQSASDVLMRMHTRGNESLVQFAIGLFTLALMMSLMMRKMVTINRGTLDNAIKTGQTSDLVKSAHSNEVLEGVARAIESKSDQDKIVALNLSLESEVNKRSRELEMVAAASLMSFIEMLETRPDVLTVEQQQTLGLCEEFANYLSLPIQSIINLRQGIFLYSYVANDGVSSLPWLETSVFEESPTLEPILSIYRNADKPWQTLGETQAFEARVFAVVKAWVTACSEHVESETVYRSAADAVNGQTPAMLDPNLVQEFYTFFQARQEAQNTTEVA